ALLLVAFAWWAAGRRRRASTAAAAASLRRVFWAVACATAAVLFYAKSGLDFLYMRYTGLFYFGAVAVALATAATWLAEANGRWRTALSWPAMALCALVIGD